MIKENFKKMIRETGGIENLVELREGIMELVCAIDDVIEMDAKLDTIEVSDKEVLEKSLRMLLQMKKVLGE